jgi:hypothetical protein
MQRIKNIKIRKGRKTALPKKQPNLERFYTPSAPFREVGTRQGFEILVTPNHGVSGYQTTGVAGSYDIQNHRPPSTFTNFVNIDPTTNSYSLQDRGSATDIQRDGNLFLTPSATNIANYDDPTMTSNANYITPTIEEMMEQGMSTSGLVISRVLQSSGDPEQGSFLRRRLFEGYAQDDPVVQTLIRDEGLDSGVSERSHHTPNTDYRNGTHTSIPYSTPRNNPEHGQNGTQNQVYQVITQGAVITPSGQSDYANISAETTPARPNDSNASTATHVQEGGIYAISTGNSQGSGTPQVAATIVPINPTPYLSLGTPPQPQVRVQEGPGQIKDVTKFGAPFQSSHRQIQFQL